jgi:hypothetical protein
MDRSRFLEAGLSQANLAISRVIVPVIAVGLSGGLMSNDVHSSPSVGCFLRHTQDPRDNPEITGQEDVGRTGSCWKVSPRGPNAFDPWH